MNMCRNGEKDIVFGTVLLNCRRTSFPFYGELQSDSIVLDYNIFFFFISFFYPGPDSSLFACSPIGSSLDISTFISLQSLRITYG